MPTGSAHPLAAILAAAAAGRFPDADGAVEVFAPDRDGTHAVVELTGHSYALTDRPITELVARGADGFGGCTHPDVVRWLAGPSGRIGTLDAVLVAPARHAERPGVRPADRPDDRPDDRRNDRPNDRLVARFDLEHHPRVRRARTHRRDVQVFGDERGMVTLGRGLVDRLELSVELHDASRGGAGAGRALIAAGLAVAPSDGLVWAQVSPGNSASLRAFLAAGFVAIGSEILLHPL